MFEFHVLDYRDRLSICKVVPLVGYDLSLGGTALLSTLASNLRSILYIISQTVQGLPTNQQYCDGTASVLLGKLSSNNIFSAAVCTPLGTGVFRWT